MLVGIISDSHDHLDRLRLGMERLEKESAEVLLHPGDIVAPFAAKLLLDWTKPLHVVYGNNDGERRGLKSVLPNIVDGPILVELEGCQISMDHYPPGTEHRPIESADVVLFGHTHEVLVEERNGVLHLNPGECCGWVTGKPTIATLDTQTRHVEIIPLGK